MNVNDINALDVDNTPSYTIDFVIPSGVTGPTGPSPKLVIGTVTTAAPGTQASVTIRPTNP